MNLLQTAIRNLGRHRRRTIITASAIAFGLIMYIFTNSLLIGGEEQTERNLKWYETAMLRIMHKDHWKYIDDPSLQYLIDNPQAIMDRLSSSFSVAPRIVFSADAVVHEDPYESSGSLPVTAYAIDPIADLQVFRIFEKNPFQAGTAVLGQWLAEDLGAHPGYPLTLVTKTRDGYYQTMELDVADIIYAPNPIINHAIFVPLDLANDLLSMQGAVTELNISLPDQDLIAEQAAIHQSVVGDGLLAVNWKELAEDFYLLNETKQASSGIIVFLIFIIAAVGITNTMLMSVQERKKEIGMLRAMGMKSTELYFLFVYEAAGIAIIGSVIAVLVGIPLVAWLVYFGIDYGDLLRNYDVGYRISDVFYGAWVPSVFVQAIVIAIVISIGTAMLPIRRALKQTIVNCLRD